MDELRIAVQRTRRRLRLSRGLVALGHAVCAATGAWIVLCLMDRLLSLHLALAWLALSGLGLSVIGAVAWLIFKGDRPEDAAVALDAAAGLKERVGTAISLPPGCSDPFAVAVIADAQRVIAGVSPRKALPLRWHRSFTTGSILIGAGLLSLLIPDLDLLRRGAARAEAAARLEAMKQVEGPMNVVREVAQQHPELAAAGLSGALEEKLSADPTIDPERLRREAIKQLDRLQSSIQDKLKNDRLSGLEQVRRDMMKAARETKPDASKDKLASALARGDFQEGRQALESASRELSKGSSRDSSEAKRRDNLARELEKLADRLNSSPLQQQAERMLRNTGLSQGEARKLLEKLKDGSARPGELSKELAKRLARGMDPEQIKRMLEQAKAAQRAAERNRELSEVFKDAARCIGNSENAKACKQLAQAAAKLKELEEMEASRSAMAEQCSKLDGARTMLDAGGTRAGTGHVPNEPPKEDKFSKGSYATRGVRGRADRMGAVAREETVRGTPLRGRSAVELQDAAAAAESEAADALSKDRVPGAYRKAVREYFDRLGEAISPASKEDGPRPQRR